MLVGDIMRGDVKTADAGDTFADVAKVMRTNGISWDRPARSGASSPCAKS